MAASNLMCDSITYLRGRRDQTSRAQGPGLSGAQNGVEQAREPGLEILAPQRVEPRGALLALANDAGLAEDLEVVGAGGLGDGHVEGRAGLLGVRVQRGDHLQAHGIAERMEDGAQLELLASGVGDLFLYDSHRTSDKVRQSSYNVRHQKMRNGGASRPRRLARDGGWPVSSRSTSTSSPGKQRRPPDDRPQTLDSPRRPLRRDAHDRPRPDDRERRASLDPARPRLQPVRPRLGGQRLPDRVRR